eukprot:1192266-Prorocentrum_minimum.AAC.2
MPLNPQTPPSTNRRARGASVDQSEPLRPHIRPLPLVSPIHAPACAPQPPCAHPAWRGLVQVGHDGPRVSRHGGLVRLGWLWSARWIDGGEHARHVPAHTHAHTHTHTHTLQGVVEERSVNSSCRV